MLPVKSGFCIWIKTFQIIFHFMATAVNFICGHEYEQAVKSIKKMKSAKTESTEENNLMKAKLKPNEGNVEAKWRQCWSQMKAKLKPTKKSILFLFLWGKNVL